MTIRAPFQPRRGVNLVTTPAASSASVSLDSQAKSVRLVNVGANICHVRMSDVASPATTADYPIPGGAQVTITKPREYGLLTHISAAGTTLHIIPGEGF